MNNIGERIKNLRKRKNLNQNEFSKTIGISQGALSDIEKNKSKPSVDTIIAISKHFNISTNWLLTGETKGSNEFLNEYYELNKELKEKGYRPENVKELINSIEKFIKNNNQ